MVKTQEQAQKAIDSFNNTFINTSKIQVDFAKPIGDESLEECYARIRKAPKVNNNNKNKDQDDEPNEETHLQKRPSLEDDPDYQEFLAARRARNVRPSWNEGLVEYIEEHEKDIENEKKQQKKKKKDAEDEKSTEAIDSNTSHDEINEKDIRGETPFFYACKYGFFEIAKTLFNTDQIDPYSKNFKGVSAMSYLSEKDQKKLL